MNILYVTPLVRGFEDLLNGDKNAKGLPTFILPLKELLERGHKVDIILVSNYRKKMNIRADWISGRNIIANINYDLTSGTKLKRLVNTVKSFVKLCTAVRGAIRKNKYDFIYCHGTAAVAGNLMANLYGIPCAYRIYGTYKTYSDIVSMGKRKAAVKNYKMYLIFKLKKEFLLITDDGSRGDKVYGCWKRKRKEYPMYFWVNGVDIVKGNEIPEVGAIPDEDYLFMAGRVTEGKGQLKGVEILIRLHEKGFPLHLYLAGHIDDERYVCKMKSMLKEKGLLEYLHLMGPISREYLKKMAYYAQSTILWQSVSNNGNVFYEVFSAGALITAIRDGSLDRFATPDENIFLAENVEEATEKVIKAISLPKEERVKMQESASAQARRTLKSWEERIAGEINLIEGTRRKGD